MQEEYAIQEICVPAPSPGMQDNQATAKPLQQIS